MRAGRASDGDPPNARAAGQSPVDSGAPSGARLPVPGDVIASKYQVVRRLGAGAMGVVYEAYHLRMRQRLAIKLPRPDVGALQPLLARFEREAQASARLRSVHAVRVVDVDSLPNGLPYMVMEYLEGRTLDLELEATGQMPVEVAVDIVTQVAEAMTEAHELGIVHCDLKPTNLFVCHAGDRPVIKVLDFGISRADEGDARITSDNEWFGTPTYIAPEQIRSESDARSDIWSLGVILFELLVNRPPFEGSTMNVLAKVIADPIPWPLEFRADLPKELGSSLMRALERDRDKRFQSMREFAAAIAPFGPERSASAVLAELQRSRGRLGEILVSDGLLLPSDLERALATQRRDGRLLGRVLLDMGLVGHADLLTAIAKQQGLATPTAGTSIGVLERERRDRGAPTMPPTTRRTWSSPPTERRAGSGDVARALKRSCVRRRPILAIVIALLLITTCMLARRHRPRERALTPRPPANLEGNL